MQKNNISSVTGEAKKGFRFKDHLILLLCLAKTLQT